MRYQHVSVENFTCTLPPHVVTSDEIEEQLSELLLMREQRRGKDGLLRRILTL